MKKLLFTMALVCSLSGLSAMPAFCEAETDPYTGEPIEWSDDTADGEVGIEESTYDSLEGMSSPTMSSSEAAEAASVVASMQETEISYGDSTGTILIVCDLPDSYPGYAIEGQIYDDNFKKTVFDCYEKNGYVAQMSLPTGHFMLGAIYVPNDSQSRYPLVSDVRDFSISAGEQKTIRVQLMSNPKTSTEEATPSELDASPEEHQKNQTATFGLVTSIIGIGLLTFLLIRKLIAKNRFE